MRSHQGWCPFCDPIFCATQLRFFPGFAAEVTTFFIWCNWLCACAPRGRTPVFINMDETSLALTFGGQKGNIQIRKRDSFFRHRFTERLSPGERRQSVSLLVSLAHIPEVHQALPQVLLGSTRFFSGTFLANYRPRMPDGIYLWANERLDDAASVLFIPDCNQCQPATPVPQISIHCPDGCSPGTSE